MKEKIPVFLLAGSMVLTVCGCGNSEPEASDITINSEVEETQEREISKEPPKEEIPEEIVSNKVWAYSHLGKAQAGKAWA